MTESMTVSINGEVHEFVKGLSIDALLCELSMAQQRVAIELNGEIVPRRLFSSTRLQQGDRVEIIHAIGGG